MKSHYRNQGDNKIIQKNREPSFMDGALDFQLNI